jgi:GNAT superfamily N-acetyltransferase
VADLVDVFHRSLEELYARRCRAPLPRNPTAVAALLDHQLRTDPEGTWVAEAADGVVGFAASHRRDRSWFLSFLFVAPGQQDRGLGRALLRACLPPAGHRERLATCAEADQPVATGLYARHGMVPRVPVYLLSGPLAPEALPALPSDVEVAPASPEVLDGIDRLVLGYARPEDHAMLRASGRSAWLLRDMPGQPIGYGYAQPSGRLGPVAVLAPGHLPAMIGFLARTVEPRGDRQVLVPGPAVHVLPALLAAGLRIDGVPAVYCATWSGPAFDRYLPMSFALL